MLCHLPVLKWAIDEGCPWTVDDKTAEGATGLGEAADHGHVELVEYLINSGANLNAIGSYGWTALQNAVLEGSVDCVNTLLRAGADVNIKNIQGTTALGVALREEYLREEYHEIADILRAAGGTV